MYEIRIRDLAQKDIQEIVNYYEDHAPFIVDKFLHALYRELERIQLNPQIFQKKYKQTRVSYVHGFSFGVHYVVQYQVIYVLAVLHTGRHPRIGENR